MGCVLFAAIFSCAVHAQRVEEALDIESVWAGHPVGFCLLTKPPNQYVAYFDANRQLTVASRTLDSRIWSFTRLDEHVQWDSHNGIVMAIDSAGNLHLAGNMHVAPLKYFRSEQPGDATTLTRVPSMIGANEDRVTYPEFLRGPGEKLVFTYRDGSSGGGNQIYNAFDAVSQRWNRLMDTPLTDGERQRNAYFVGPVTGPDGYYHVCWVWRDTPDCTTNHDLSYARSKDLVHWERSDGTPYQLPITLATSEIVDPIPVNGGVINGCTQIGFDAARSAVVAYHKFDANGNTQIYNARVENGKWQVRQLTTWEYRWEFRGPGSITSEIHVRPVQVESDGSLTQAWSHVKHGSQRWRLNPATLTPEERVPDEPSPLPGTLRNVVSSFPGVGVRIKRDSGQSDSTNHYYIIRWETLGHNRDRPRDPPWPDPSMLCVYRIAK
ncbi:MAG: BNR-4 repeat-containing protein [Candidatus Hydrogenedentes bacterium]|nr:BNR-4 repeat-containing protein [Candidatus Hydrogenedentota bacterium]